MYPSDLTDVQWATLEPLLKPPRGPRHAGGRPRKYELRGVVDALLYVVKTGCQLRQMPADFPPDRKSTRLNSSHLGISYAVFCLKKKNNIPIRAALPLSCPPHLQSVRLARAD